MFSYLNGKTQQSPDVVLTSQLLTEKRSRMISGVNKAYIIHLMCAPEGNSEFCFPESLNVSRDEVEGNIDTRGKTKLTISRGSTH